MGMWFLVSIVIPAYNAAANITGTIKSALGQTWPRKEIIVVDDGSTDNTLCVAKQFASSEVKVITQEHQGACAARNAGFRACQGEYIQWLDADDLLAPDKIAKQMEAASDVSKKTLLSSPWGTFFYRVSKARFGSTLIWQDLRPVDWLFLRVKENAWMAQQSWLVSRELTDLAGPWDTRLSTDQDGEYFGRVVAASEGTKFVKGAKSYYRGGNFGSVSNSIHLSPRNQDSLFLSTCLQIQYLRSMEDSERTRKACLQFLQRRMIDFYPERPDIVSRAQELAAELGGHLEKPQLSWKYAWMTHLMGWRLAKRASVALPKARGVADRAWDRLLTGLD